MKLAETKGGITKGQEETFEEDGYLSCLDDDGFTSQNLSNCTFKYVKLTVSQLHHSKDI